MDLYNHSNPPFTNWVMETGLLREKFVVIDIGCQGGEHPRWSFLGDKLQFYGFDPIREVIEALRNTAKPGRSYFEFALGDQEGEREFFVSGNTFSSSFFGGDNSASNGFDEIQRGRRTVPVCRLDSVFAKGVIPVADYIKLDCEGFEPHVLQGARNYLSVSNPICVSTEATFNLSPHYPYSHFHAVNQVLAEHKLRVFDVNMVRAPRPLYASALQQQPWPEPNSLSDVPHLDVGAPGTLDVVFCKDFTAHIDDLAASTLRPFSTDRPRVDQLIKAMINFELHGLMDCAFEIAIRFREHLQERMDVDRAAKLLLTRAPHARNTADVVNCLSMIAKLRERVRADALTNEGLIAKNNKMADELRQLVQTLAETKEQLRNVYNSTSWRVTAPLRKIKTWVWQHHRIGQ